MMADMLAEMGELSVRLGSVWYTDIYQGLKEGYRLAVTQAKLNYNNKRILNATDLNKECWNIINERKSKNKQVFIA